MQKITLAYLRSKGACNRDVVLFQKHFGDEAEVTSYNIAIARAAEMDVFFLWTGVPTTAREQYRQGRKALEDRMRARYSAGASIENLMNEFYGELNKLITTALRAIPDPAPAVKWVCQTHAKEFAPGSVCPDCR